MTDCVKTKEGETEIKINWKKKGRGGGGRGGDKYRKRYNGHQFPLIQFAIFLLCAVYDKRAERRNAERPRFEFGDLLGVRRKNIKQKSEACFGGEAHNGWQS